MITQEEDCKAKKLQQQHWPPHGTQPHLRSAKQHADGWKTKRQGNV